jgi:hypothetical protein
MVITRRAVDLDRDMRQFLVLAEKLPDGLGRSRMGIA